ncbi:hypothetical protein PGT21_014478 [Puccinia graminis f. sp. tritici]|uniref:Uncharacterized protein n=1 Tax=Puccinia graminis f. sp. tritici TaxID=56615 RepID=A0A5B0Q355_PUCGR|nr:hypothetical protein PGT21_014478 [Puccinia graminis f. sp. tritici]KAA1124737.1 hypothetical protein PGTUg99_033274 [Puccinia graminis f. sp. tritici]
MCRTSGSTSPRERRLTSRTEAHLANGGSPREQRLTSRTAAHLANRGLPREQRLTSRTEFSSPTEASGKLN